MFDLFFKKFYKDFQEYTFKNQVLVAASGFAIGITTTDFIKNIIEDIYKPFIIFASSHIIKLLPISTKEYPILFTFIFKFFDFFSILFIWLSTIFISFFVIEYILNRKIIGLSSVILEKEKDEYIKQKMESQSKNNIIPNKTDIIELNNQY
jgi:hypothetical protein